MIGSEEFNIYWAVSDMITIERKGGTPVPFDLPARYVEFKEKYFKGCVPDLSDDFICAFQKLPFDVVGITFLEEDAQKAGVRKGIRINEKLKEFPNEAQVALLHEMIHASGIKGHNVDFKTAVRLLWDKNAYLYPLII